MKKVGVWVLLGVVSAMGLMVGLRWKENRSTQEGVQRIEALSERRIVAGDLAMTLEQYRRQNAAFKHMTNSAIEESKRKFKDRVSQLVENLAPAATAEASVADAESAVALKRVGEGLSELMLKSAQVEHKVYSRDVYQREEITKVNDALLGDLKKVRELAATQIGAIQKDLDARASASLRYSVYAAIAIVGLVFLLLAVQYAGYVLPARRLGKWVEGVRPGSKVVAPPKLLGPAFSPVVQTIERLAVALEEQTRSRQGFLLGVALDLRSPLVTIQTASNLMLAGDEGASVTPEERAHAREQIRSCAYRVNKTLDDLIDLIEMSQSELRIEEKVVDLASLLRGVARTLSAGDEGSGSVRVRMADSLAGQPIWASVDPSRLERAIVHMASKVQETSVGRWAQGTEIFVHAARERKGGIEIRVQGAVVPGETRTGASGPAQDAESHWISENGHGIRLARRIAVAHGGNLHAAGLAGTDVQLALWIPGERIAGEFNAGSTARGATSMLGVSAQTRPAIPGLVERASRAAPASLFGERPLGTV